jgi:hypothetical protein
MGLFDRSKPQQETPQASWEAQRARAASFVYRARTFNGTGPEDPTLTVKLRPEERALLVATGTFLVEPRRVQSYWSGLKGGFSFDLAHRAAGPGQENEQVAGLTPVDTGDVTFTNQRIIFSGQHQSREWEYSDILGFSHSDLPPWTAIAVSGRDRVSGFRYDEGQAEEIRFAIALGIARFKNAADSLLGDLQEQLDAIDRQRAPANAYAPAAPAPAAPAPGAPAPAAPAPATPPAPAAVPTPPPAESPAPSASSEPAAASAPPVTWSGEPPSVSTATAPTEAFAPPSPTEAPVKDTVGPTAEDTEAPTGEIPAVSPMPTATYPAVRPGAAAPAQQVQAPAQPGAHPATNMPPGWYPDPWRLARVRWWDGYAWTAYTSH